MAHLGCGTDGILSSLAVNLTNQKGDFPLRAVKMEVDEEMNYPPLCGSFTFLQRGALSNRAQRSSRI